MVLLAPKLRASIISGPAVPQVFHLGYPCFSTFKSKWLTYGDHGARMGERDS